jgi:DNA invertase Pin-like site-specific DNA recombinase
VFQDQRELRPQPLFLLGAEVEPGQLGHVVDVDLDGHCYTPSMSSTTRAAGYVRISKDDPDGTSPQRQRRAIEALAKARGYDLVEVFEDIGVSATAKRRPAFGRMMSGLPDLDVVIFWRIDRLARSVRDFQHILDECEKAGTKLVSTDQGAVDTTSAMGRAFVQIVAVFAELEAATTGERSRAMIAYKRQRQEWLGRVPTGWRRNGKGIEPDPKQAAILAKVAERYIAGESFHKLAREHGYGHGQTLRRILRSDRTAQLLDPELADRLAAALTGRRSVRVLASAQSLLAGIAVCGRCGAGLHASSTRPGRPGWLGQYRCSSGGHVGVARGWLDDYVINKVVNAIDTGKLLEAIWRRQKAGHTRKASAIEARLELLEDEFDAGTLTPARYRERRGRLLEALQQAQEKERQNGVHLSEELARDLSNRWDDLTVIERRQIVRAVLERVEVGAFDGVRAGRPRSGVDPGRVHLIWRS